jgi:hypothetical protein
MQWQKADVFSSAAVIKANKVYVLFRVEDMPSTYTPTHTVLWYAK